MGDKLSKVLDDCHIVTSFGEDAFERAAAAAFDCYFDNPLIFKWDSSIHKPSWRRVVLAVIKSLSFTLTAQPVDNLKKRIAASRLPRIGPSSTTTQTTKANRARTEEKSGHRARPCETRVHAAAERRSSATMRAGKRQVKPRAKALRQLGSPKPTGGVNRATRNAMHERRERSRVTPGRRARTKTPYAKHIRRAKVQQRLQRSPVAASSKHWGKMFEASSHSA